MGGTSSSEFWGRGGGNVEVLDLVLDVSSLVCPLI